MIYILYNPLAGNRTCEERCKNVGDIFGSDEKEYIDLLTIDDLEGFIKGMKPDDQIVICGGDGTLNTIINSINTFRLEQDILYYPGGSGNDFYRDIDEERKNGVYRINRYLKNLPTIKVKDIERYFLNGIGFGLDGYCCEEGDKKRIASPGKKVNYSVIALKGLLYGYKKTIAKVTVDGITEEYKDVWMAATMNGRFYGGGMMCAPNQNRLNEDGLVSVIVVHSRSRIALLCAFLSVFKGQHIKYKKLVSEIKGTYVKVVFDRPTALQIDGETVTDVTEYVVSKEKKIIC